MTAQEAERLAVVENDIKWLVEWALKVDGRLDKAIKEKADKSDLECTKSDVKTISKRLYAIGGGVAVLAFIVPIAISLLTK